MDVLSSVYILRFQCGSCASPTPRPVSLLRCFGKVIPRSKGEIHSYSYILKLRRLRWVCLQLGCRDQKYIQNYVRKSFGKPSLERLRKIILKRMLSGREMDKTASRSCPMVRVDISGVGPLNSTSRRLVGQLL